LYDEATKLPVSEGVLSKRNRRFGDYELGEPLGRGGMGVVYHAMQVSLRRSVALKMILDSEAAAPTARRRFTLEAEAAAKLDHPNIVPIYEVGEHDGQPFLSMKFIAGENLRKKIADGDLCLTPKGSGTSKADIRDRAIAIARVMAAISRAVHHAHQHGVLHRDLKPANILVDRESQPHLTDFGLAKMLDSEAEEEPRAPLTLSGTALGTPSYMSPEQAAGRRLTAASDIYSLGAILYEMLAGEPPFQAGTLLETLRLVAEEEPKHPSVKNPRIDKDLDTICFKCLEKNPVARYPTAEALAEDLERWLRQEPIRARRAGLGLRVRRWVARNRVGTALIVSLCTGLAIALALLQLTMAHQKKLDLHRANALARFSRGVEEMWKDSERPWVPISSTDLAEIANLPPRTSDALTLRITFGLSINQEPFGQAMQYAPLLSVLEQRLEKSLQRPVQIDLRLYKSQTNALRDAARGQLDLQRMGAFNYVLLKQTHPGLEPVVRERGQREAVIFASAVSGVTNLAQVAGRRVAFGQTNSATSFWAKFHLARAGIRATNLQSYSLLENGNRRRDGDPARPEDQDPEIQSQKRVIQEVALGHADIGEAPRRQFELARYKRHGLVPLLVYSVTPDVYVARPGLEPEVLRALQESLGSIQGQEAKTLLAKLTHSVVIEGFDTIGDQDFDDIRSAQRREVAEFERGTQNETPKTQPANFP
jgi:tRNA A-37 threonylcarbamoyl transferase component Bud32